MADRTQPELPANTPDGVRRFVECSSDILVLKAGRLDWIDIPDIPVTPEVTFELDRSSKNSVIVHLSAAGQAIGSFQLSITGDALLSNAKDWPEGVPGIVPAQEWLFHLNEWVWDHGKYISRLELKGQDLEAAKSPLPGTGTSDSGAAISGSAAGIGGGDGGFSGDATGAATQTGAPAEDATGDTAAGSGSAGAGDPKLDTGHYDDGHSLGWKQPVLSTPPPIEPEGPVDAPILPGRVVSTPGGSQAWAEADAGSDSGSGPGAWIAGIMAVVIILIAATVLLVFHPLKFGGGQGGGGQGGGANQPAAKDADAGKGLQVAEGHTFGDAQSDEHLENRTGMAGSIQLVVASLFAQDTQTTVTTKPALAMHTKTTQQGAVFETTVAADGSGCTVANGTTTPYRQAPLTLDAIQPWAPIAGFSGAAYGPDAVVGDHTDWVVNVTLPNPNVPGRTFTLNTAKAMINSKLNAIEEIDLHATWTDSQANIGQPDLHRELNSAIKIRYDTGATIPSC